MQEMGACAVVFRMVNPDLAFNRVCACYRFQFEESGCENCPFLSMKQDRDKVDVCTTASFSGYEGTITGFLGILF